MLISGLDSEYEERKSVLGARKTVFQRVVWHTGSEVVVRGWAEAGVVVRPLTPAER